MRSLPARPAPVDSRMADDRSTARTHPRLVSRKQGSARHPATLIITIVGVALAADGRDSLRVGEALGVANGSILGRFNRWLHLRAAVGVVHQISEIVVSFPLRVYTA